MGGWLNKDSQPPEIFQIWHFLHFYLNKSKIFRFVPPRLPTPCRGMLYWMILFDLRIVLSYVCIIGHLSVNRGIIHHFLPRNTEELLGYFLKGEDWIPIPYSGISSLEDKGSKCQSVFLWKCVSEIFDKHQIMILNWIYCYFCLQNKNNFTKRERLSKE